MVAVALIAAGCSAPVSPGGPTLRLAGDASGGFVVELSGLDRPTVGRLRSATAPQLAAALVVVTGAAATAEGADQPPVLGSVELVGERLQWRPRYPLVAGQHYVAHWRGLDAVVGAPPFLSADLSVPATDATPSTVVEAIYPSTEQVPANLLRLYVQFSAPMRQGVAVEHFEILANGQPLAGAFVVPEQELWSPQRDRLTLFFDPGRLKLQVGPNLQVGPPLRPGDTILVRVSANWQDGRGVPMRAPFEKRYRVIEEDRSRPDPATWHLIAPASRDGALVLELPEVLDRGLLMSMLSVQTESGTLVSGDVEIDAGDQRWLFRPREPWGDDSYALVVDAEIEDLAGNSIERLFDEPLRAGRVGEEPMADVLLPFSVGS